MNNSNMSRTSKEILDGFVKTTCEEFQNIFAIYENEDIKRILNIQDCILLKIEPDRQNPFGYIIWFKSTNNTLFCYNIYYSCIFKVVS